jgi:hypothetical protein
MNKIAIATVGLYLFTGGAVFAASSSDVADQPQVHVAVGIPYISGGVGVDERETLRQRGSNDNLELSFALRNKQYLGGADVVIKDSKGNKIFEAASGGPLLYARLPQGTYTVEATADGKTLTQAVHVPAKGQARVFFAWPGAQETRDYRTASK